VNVSDVGKAHCSLQLHGLFALAKLLSVLLVLLNMISSVGEWLNCRQELRVWHPTHNERSIWQGSSCALWVQL